MQEAKKRISEELKMKIKETIKEILKYCEMEAITEIRDEDKHFFEFKVVKRKYSFYELNNFNFHLKQALKKVLNTETIILNWNIDCLTRSMLISMDIQY